MLITGFIFLFIGIAILYWINRRKFNRRGIAGVEEFKSYENALIIKIIERIGKCFGYILIALGMLYFWRYSRHIDENKNTGKKKVPVAKIANLTLKEDFKHTPTIPQNQIL